MGVGRDPGAGYKPNIRQMAIDLSQRRIDAIGHRIGQIDIIEITPHAGIKAIGQLEVYPTLYRWTFRPTFPLVPVLICRDISPDIQLKLAASDIFVYRYPETSVTR